MEEDDPRAINVEDNAPRKKRRRHDLATSEEDKLERRAEANRRSSAQARQRQRDEIDILKKSNNELLDKIDSVKRENERLKVIVGTLRMGRYQENVSALGGLAYRTEPVQLPPVSHSWSSSARPQWLTVQLPKPSAGFVTCDMISRHLSCEKAVKDRQDQLMLSFADAPQVSEADLSKEWNALTVTEKEESIHDVQGRLVVDDNATVKEVGEKRLPLMDLELESILENEKQSFLEALRECPDLSACKEKKIQFLHCEGYNPRLAAFRYVNYWARKFELFGRSRAVRPITIKDSLASEEKEIMSDYVRLLSGVDSYGRGVLYIEPVSQIEGGSDSDGKLRVLWYVVHMALENESIRKNGIVIIFNAVGLTPQNYNLEVTREIFDMLKNAFPLRIRGVHLCSPPTHEQWHSSFRGTFLFVLGKILRCRLRVHTGTVEGILGHLEEFGISRDLLPTKIGGSVTPASFLALLLYRKARNL